MALYWCKQLTVSDQSTSATAIWQLVVSTTLKYKPFLHAGHNPLWTHPFEFNPAFRFSELAYWNKSNLCLRWSQIWHFLLLIWFLYFLFNVLFQVVVTTCPCRCLHLKAAASRAITQTTPLHPLINPPPSTLVATPTLGNTKGHHSHPRTPTHPPSHPKGAKLILPHLTYQLVSKTEEASVLVYSVSLIIYQ